MRIFYSPSSDPMVLDTEAALHEWARALLNLPTNQGVSFEFAADTDGDPAPYTVFLQGLRLTIAAVVNAECFMTVDGWLELRIGREDLNSLCSSIFNLRADAHIHLYAGPVSLIVEADDTWRSCKG